MAPKFVHVQVTRVDKDYLNTMGIRLLGGRGFLPDDRAGTELVTIISKTLAEKLFPNTEAGQAIGKRLIFGNDEKTMQTITVVGASGDFPTSQMSTAREQLLLPLAQQPSRELFLIARRIRVSLQLAAPPHFHQWSPYAPNKRRGNHLPTPPTTNAC